MVPKGGEDSSPSESRFDSGPEVEQPVQPRVRAVRYRMSTELAGLDSDFLVLNGAGEHVFRIDGRAFTEEDTISVEDLEGRVLSRAVVHLARKQRHIAIDDERGNQTATVVRFAVSPLRDRFGIELANGQELSIEGRVAAHEFSIVEARGQIAEVSQRWFRARGSYGVEIGPGQPDALLITSIAVMDLMVHAAD